MRYLLYLLAGTGFVLGLGFILFLIGQTVSYIIDREFIYADEAILGGVLFLIVAYILTIIGSLLLG